MPRGTPRPAGARAIIYACAFGRLTLQQANDMLVAAGWAAYVVPESTWDMIVGGEVPKFEEDPSEMGNFIVRPRSRADF